MQNVAIFRVALSATLALIHPELCYFSCGPVGRCRTAVKGLDSLH